MKHTAAAVVVVSAVAAAWQVLRAVAVGQVALHHALEDCLKDCD